ncbi:MAG: hypothetical protein V1817_04960 [Candidatus Micrarchaeota archaeon]
MIASLLAVTTAALLLYVLTANAHSFASRADDARLQTAAFIASEKALKTCTSEGGAAKCSGGFVFVNELYAAAPTAAQANESLGAEEKRACVSRIVLVGGEQQIAVFCTGEGGLN